MPFCWVYKKSRTSGFSNHVTFLPKVSDPRCPSDLRPVGLSSTVGKVFTKCLMLRMRPRFPAIKAYQVGGIPSRQTLDWVRAVQHAIRLAQQYGTEQRKTQFSVKKPCGSMNFSSVQHFVVHASLAASCGVGGLGRDCRSPSSGVA